MVMLAATVLVGLSPYNALFLMGMAIAAGLISIFIDAKLVSVNQSATDCFLLPASSLITWWFVAFFVPLHANFQLFPIQSAVFGIIVSQDVLWFLLAAFGLGLSFGYNGSAVWLALLAGTWTCAGLVSFIELDRARLFDPAPLALLLSFVIGSMILMLRYSRATTNGLESELKALTLKLGDTKTRLAKQAEELVNVRESLLGGFDLHSEPNSSGVVDLERNHARCSLDLLVQNQPVLNFSDLILDLRGVFQEYQLEGRRRGEVLGPVRFVFFPPASGYDSRAEVKIDREQLKLGITACLGLAYESLPESAGRRREGVIRLSIRRGLRFVEIVIEDNGKGLHIPQPKIETEIEKLRSAIDACGGRFDRITRLGVGGRTSLELQILRQAPRSASYRPTLLHSDTVADFEMKSGIKPLLHSEMRDG